MKLGVPWSVKGIRPEARETAREAARRSGMSLGDWLNTVILNSASEQDFVDEDESGHDGSEDVAAVHAKLDDLTRRIDRLSKTAKGPEAYAPPHVRSELDPRADLTQRLPSHAYPSMPAYAPAQHYAQPQTPPQAAHYAPAAPPMPHAVPPAVQAYAAQRSPHPAQSYAPPPQQPVTAAWAGHFGNAAAEIAARRRALNGEPAPTSVTTPQPAIRPPPAEVPVFQTPLFNSPTPESLAPLPSIVTRHPTPAQDLSGLEEQLRQITDRIDTLRTPGVEDAINALRGELAHIGQSLNDAMPRQAIDTIERQIQSLTQRIAEGRQAGVDGNALAGLEQGITEVRDALYRLTPAESLIGFNEAIDGLAQKIDMIVAQRDPHSLEQLENAINTLRQVATHIASDEAVSRVASDVAMLAEKVDRLAHAGASDALSGLEERISALSDALAQRSQSGINVPPQLEALVHSLSDKIEQLQNSRGDNLAFSALEDRIVKLVEKLDASDSRLAHLEAVERGLGDLLIQMSELRAQAGGAGRLHEASGGVDAIKSDLARTQNEIEAVHGTLGQVVDRLATIERNMLTAKLEEAERPLQADVGRLAVRAVPVEAEGPAAPTQPVADDPFSYEFAPPVAHDEPPPPARPPTAGLGPAPQLAPTIPSPPLAPAAPPIAAPAPVKPPTRARNAPINPDLPPDEPIEPGAGPLHLRADFASRIAASEAALGLSIPAPADEPQGKAGFIAAARRAAQAALKETGARSPFQTADDPIELTGRRRSLLGAIRKRMKSLLIAGSLIILVIAGVQFGAKFFGISIPGAVGGKHAPAALKTDKQGALEHDHSNRVAAALPLPGMIPPPSQYGYLGPSSPPMAAMAALTSPQSQNDSDVTGSVAARPQQQANAAPPAVAPPQTTLSDDLPSTIGSPALRNAAGKGDAAAAFEIAVRYAEGRGVAANPTESVRWFERAAAQGLAPAQFRLGTLYEKGQGVRKDVERARGYYLAAAAQGNAKAMHNLAVLYAEGIAGKPDFKSATQWFKKAAEHGVADSQYNLAVLYARGLGVEKNLSDSYKWFALAAAQGDKEAARKRDEVASHLDAKELAAAKLAVSGFHALKQPASAVTVPQPAGGWDARQRVRTQGPITLGQR